MNPSCRKTADLKPHIDNFIYISSGTFLRAGFFLKLHDGTPRHVCPQGDNKKQGGERF